MLTKINNHFTHVVILTIVIYSILIGIAVGTYKYTSSISGDLNKPEKVSYYIEETNSCVILKDSTYHTEYMINNCIYEDKYFYHLLSNLKIVRHRFNSHDKTMIFFMEQRFIFNILRSVMIMVTTIIGLYVSKEGWNKTHRLVLLTFFILGGALVFVEIVPISLDIENNILNNKSKCIIYKNLETDIITYMTTNENNNGETVDIKDYIHYTSNKMKNEYSISFDLKEIPNNHLEFDNIK